MRALSTGCLLLSAFVLGCSGSGSDSTNDGSTSGGGSGPALSAGDFEFDTGKFEVPAGDSLTCFYLDARTPKELSVTGGKAVQGPGGHHVIISWTDATRPAQHHPCSDAEMVSWHQFAADAGASGEGAEGILKLPEGFAARVPEGKQIVIQSHYINTTGHSEIVDDTMTIHTEPASQVKEYVNYFALADTDFTVPPNSSLKRTTECVAPRDLDNVILLGHMHQYGTRYKLEVMDGTGDDGETLYDKAWQPLYTTHPPIDTYSLAKPLKIAKGTRMRQTCEWANTTPQPLTFPTEMCVGFFYYFPDAGEITCDLNVVP